MGRNRGGNRRGGRAPQQQQQQPQRTRSPPREEETGPLPTFSWKSVPVTALPEDTQSAVNRWADRFTAEVDSSYGTHIRNQIQSTVEQVPSLQDKEQLHQLSEFYRRHPNVSGAQEDWKPVVGSRLIGTGYKVCNSRGKRLWGGDDGVYRANPSLQENLPRGCVLVQREDNDDPALAIFANRKFYGRSSGDDDDSDLTSETIRRGNYTHFLVSEKANGESCQVTLCPFDSKYWIIGSKNKKIIASTAEEASRYKNVSVYGFAVEMAVCFFQYLDRMGADRVAELKELFALTRWTLNFEFESVEHQHIVRLDKAQLVLIGCSGIHVPAGKAAHPVLGCAIARYFGFASVLRNLQTYDKSELDSTCAALARDWDTEGAVLILLDSDSNVVDFVKVKSWWYILLRCIREKIRPLQRAPDTVASACRGVIKRVRTLQNSMKIDPVYGRCFTKLGVAFAEWMSKDAKRLAVAIDQYPVLWTEFLRERNLPLDSSLLNDFRDEAMGGATEEDAPEYQRSALPLLVLTQGVPGIGKSYLARKLAERLNAEGITCKDVAQDDFVAQVGLKNSGKACRQYLQEELAKRTYQVIILARNNADQQQYRDFVGWDEQLCRAVFICPEELSTRLEEAIFISVASVLYRQESGTDNHPTDSMDSCALASLPLKFFGTLRVHNSAFLVRVLQPNPVPLPNPQKFGQLLTRFKSKGFKAADVSPDDLRVLGLTERNQLREYMKYRRNIDECVDDSYKFLKHILHRNTPEPGSYFAVTLSSESSNHLMEAAAKCFPDGAIPKDWNLSLDHVTFMHSSSYYKSPQSVGLWETLDKHRGTQVVIQPVGLLINSRLATLQVHCETLEKKNSLDSYVTSGVPHVTIATAPSVSAFESVDELKKNANALVPLELPFLVSGVLDLVYGRA